MTGLVRKAIIDKNGHASTRWVRPEGSAGGGVPIPAAPAPATAQQASAKAAASVFRECGDLGEYDEATVCAAIGRFTPLTVAALSDELNADDGVTRQRIATLGRWIEDYADNEPYLRDLMAFRGCFYEYADRNFIELAVSGLSGYSFVPAADGYSALDADRRAGVERILQLAEAAYMDEFDRGEGDVFEPVLPEPLAELVFTRPEDFDRITSFVVDGVLDGQRIREMLDSETPAIAEGIL